MIAAAFFFLAALQDPSPADLARTFLYGTDPESARAREGLASRGPAAIPALIAARKPGANRAEALDDLLFDLKAAAAGDAGRPLFEKLRKFKLSVDMQNAPSTAVLDYLREIGGLNLALDPGLPAEPTAITLILADVPFRRALEGLCAKAGLDYDYRCGVLLLSTPGRLWAPTIEPRKVPLTEEEKKKARAWIAELGADSPKTRDQAAAELRKLGPETVPLLGAAARVTDAETAARAKDLVAELTFRPGRWSRLPDQAAWRSQKLEGADLEIARRLDTTKIHLAFEGVKPEDILGFIREFTELKIEGPAKRSEREVTLKVSDLPVGQCLELLLLPLGLDLRIEKGAIQILERK
ncbi:MAG TPA: hypothetical protein VJB14_07205 [Planctomycetota bacterium]|nr:hypothetical protein [Planctomycetota bacterium]